MRRAALTPLVLCLFAGLFYALRDGDSGSVLVAWLAPSIAPASSVAEASPSDTPPRAAAPKPQAPRPAAAVATAEPAQLVQGGEQSTIDEMAGPVLYRYTDARGAIRMVRGMAEVPLEHRVQAVVVGAAHRTNFVVITTREIRAFQDWQPATRRNRGDVVLFGASWCGACTKARLHLDRLGVRYDERDIDDDPEAREHVRETLGSVAIPLLEVGARKVSGYLPDAYERLLGTAG